MLTPEEKEDVQNIYGITDRGVIRNRGYATQIRDFRNLRFSNITPTDIDGLIEYQNICYVFIETKHAGAELPRGQELALERITDDLEKVKPTITIVASHNTQGDIDVGNAEVTKVRWNRKWRTMTEITTTKALIDRFFSWVETMSGDNA